MQLHVIVYELALLSDVPSNRVGDFNELADLLTLYESTSIVQIAWESSPLACLSALLVDVYSTLTILPRMSTFGSAQKRHVSSKPRSV